MDPILSRGRWVNTLRLKQYGHHFADAFSWKEMFVFWFKFHWSVFLNVQLTISQHWFRWWLGTVHPHVNDKCNTLKPKQNGHHFPDNIFKCIFLNWNIWISIEISLKFVLKGPINNIPSLVQMMAWCRSGNKPLSEPMMVSLLTHICVTRPQWVNIVA